MLNTRVEIIESIGRLGVALLLGSVIGFERQWHQKMAGRIDSADIADTSKVTITAQVLAAKRNDVALEQIVGRLSLEPHINAVTWEVSRLIPEA